MTHMVDCRARTEWFTSSRTTNAEACVEVRFDGDDVHVRDTKDNGRGPILSVPAIDWPSFLIDVRDDRTNASAPLLFERTSDGGARLFSIGHPAVLTYTAKEWIAFVEGVRDGEFDPAIALTAPDSDPSTSTSR